MESQRQSPGACIRDQLEGIREVLAGQEAVIREIMNIFERMLETQDQIGDLLIEIEKRVKDESLHI